MDNITGFGGGSDEISLGLNFNSNVGGTINDFNTLDQVLQQIIKDEETFKGIQSDSFEQAKALTQELRSSGEQGQQLISIFRALRGEQQSSLQDAKQLASVYQQLNNELQKTVQNKTRLGITSPGAGVPGSIPSAGTAGGPGAIPGVPATQTGSGSGGGGVRPPIGAPTAGYPEEPDDFFGKEETKSGARRPSSRRTYDPAEYSGTDLSDIQDIQLTPADLVGGSGGAKKTSTAAAQNEKYKQLSDLAWTIFPNRGYYRNMRRIRWLTRNEGGAINKFINSAAGQRMGLALNRLGGGQNLRTNEGYQLFPFMKNENGDYVDANSNIMTGQYGLQDAQGNWIAPPGEGLEGPPGPAWSWNGEGTPPPLPPGVDPNAPRQFNPWERPNLTATGEGAAKIAGGMFAARAIKAKGGDLFREGQLYTGITGGTGIRGALGYDIGAQLTSWFGLNPLESYGQAKQITMQNLALGYRGGLLGQANAFGNFALQKYGVDPQTSMQMFGQMVMQVGGSLNDLNASLETLANTASTTNTSFGQLQQSVIQYSQVGGAIGLTGGQNVAFATAAAQFAAGQPGLQATGANPADILNSMVGQALVAQQMGTSYLGLPGAAQQQGAGGVLAGEIRANEQLFNNMGITASNYANSANYQRFKLVMAQLGMTKEANMSYTQYLNYMRDTWGGKQRREFARTQGSAYSQAMQQGPGKTFGEAIASALGPRIYHLPGKGGGVVAEGPDEITSGMGTIERQQRWGNIGVAINGRFMSLNQIEQLPYAQRMALEARIATGDQPLSHINRQGKLVQGDYASGTWLDLRHNAQEQFSAFGKTPNREAMHRAERRAMTIELGPNAKKIFTLLENPNNLNRYQNNNWKAGGLPTSPQGNPRTSNS